MKKVLIYYYIIVAGIVNIFRYKLILRHSIISIIVLKEYSKLYDKLFISEACTAAAAFELQIQYDAVVLLRQYLRVAIISVLLLGDSQRQLRGESCKAALNTLRALSTDDVLLLRG